MTAGILGIPLSGRTQKQYLAAELLVLGILQCTHNLAGALGDGADGGATPERFSFFQCRPVLISTLGQVYPVVARLGQQIASDDLDAMEHA